MWAHVLAHIHTHISIYIYNNNTHILVYSSIDMYIYIYRCVCMYIYIYMLVCVKISTSHMVHICIYFTIFRYINTCHWTNVRWAHHKYSRSHQRWSWSQVWFIFGLCGSHLYVRYLSACSFKMPTYPERGNSAGVSVGMIGYSSPAKEPTIRWSQRVLRVRDGKKRWPFSTRWWPMKWAPDIKSTLASKKGTGSSTFCAPGPMVTLSQSLMGFHRKTYRTCPPWLDGKKPWDIAGRCPMIFPEKPFHSKPKYRWFSSL